MPLDLPRFLPVDTEKMAPAQLLAAHVSHPDVPDRFDRSSLLIGSRGVGKTFILRHRMHTIHDHACYVNLKTLLSSISRETGAAGRAIDCAPELSVRIAAKTAALLALEILRQQSGEFDLRRLDRHAVNTLLPRSCRLGAIGPDTVRRTQQAVVHCRLSGWPDRGITGYDESLGEFLASIKAARPNFALLLDRAEDVSGPSIEVLVTLLDQSCPVLTVLAGRPALAQLMTTILDRSFIPGDHFDLHHVGIWPYGATWMRFVESCVHKYFEINDIQMTSDANIMWALRMCRDSVRDAIQYSQYSLGEYRDMDLRRNKLVERRQSRVARSSGFLVPYGVRFEDLLRTIRRKAGEQLDIGPQRPLHIKVRDVPRQLAMLPEPDVLRSALLEAIRTSSLFLTEGQAWHPYELPDLFELAPILAWNERNLEWIQ